MTTPTTTASRTVAEETLRSALASGKRPRRPKALSASLTFGWRAMLKIKHVPEQLFDVTVFPVMFTLMFTYLFGGAIAGSTGEYLQFLLPGILVQTIVFISWGLISVAAVSVVFGPVSGLWLVFPLGVLALAAARGPEPDGRS